MDLLVQPAPVIVLEVSPETVEIAVTVEPQPPIEIRVAAASGESLGWSHGDLAESPDGQRVLFTLPSPYIGGSIVLFLNGIRESHFTETSDTEITFSSAPFPGDEIWVMYQMA